MYLQKTFYLIVLLVSIFLWLTPQCSAHGHEESHHNALTQDGAIKLSDDGKSAIGLHTEKVAMRAVPRHIQTTGKLEPIPTREFIQHAPIAGRIAQVLVRLGDQVKEGQTLLTLSSPDLQEIGAQIVSEKTQIESEISTRKAELDGDVSQASTQKVLAEANFGRESKLFAEKIASQKAMQQSKAEFELAENKLKVAQKTREVTLAALKTKLSVNLKALKQKLKQLGVSEADINRMLAQKTSMTTVPVRTVRAGIITELSATPGQSIDESIALAKVSDLSQLWATANIYESDMSRVKLGEPIVLKVAAFPNDTFSGKISFISSNVDPVGRVLPVKVEVFNRGNKLRPGMFADLSVETAEPSQAIALPKDAVILDKGHYLVYVAKDDGFMPVPVEVGNAYGDKIEIRKGIEVGQEVVVRGAFQLDAQRLKSIGDTDLFAHPTEEGHEEHEDEHGGGSSNSLITPQFLIIIAIAFVLGCSLTALLLRKRTRKVTDETAHREAGVRDKGV